MSEVALYTKSLKQHFQHDPRANFSPKDFGDFYVVLPSVEHKTVVPRIVRTPKEAVSFVKIKSWVLKDWNKVAF